MFANSARLLSSTAWSAPFAVSPALKVFAAVRNCAAFCPVRKVLRGVTPMAMISLNPAARMVAQSVANCASAAAGVFAASASVFIALRNVYIAELKAQDVARSLTGSSPAPGGAAATRILSARGSVLSDVRTNQVFVSDVPARLVQVQDLLRNAGTAEARFWALIALIDVQDKLEMDAAELASLAQATQTLADWPQATPGHRRWLDYVRLQATWRQQPREAEHAGGIGQN